MLPQVLAAGHEMNIHNTTNVLKLAVILEPNEMSGIALVRFLYQLIMFILKNEYDSNLVSLGIRNAYCLLQLCIRRNVVQGITMFTKEPRLIAVLKNVAFAKKDPALSYICFRCLSFLISCQAKYSIQCPDCLEIELDDLLKEMSVDECSGAVELATVMLIGKVENPVIKLKKMSPGSSSDNVIIAFYLQLHGNLAKSGPADRELLYILLVKLLDYCKAVGNLKILKNLCEQPWTCIIIKMTIEANRSVMDSDFMVFVSNWLFHRYYISRSYSAPREHRSLCRDQFDTTLDLIGKASLATYRKYPKRSSLRELIDILMIFQDQFSDDVAVEMMDLEIRLGKN
ncbi:uncharacterized protein LOC124294531 [Neodiprion lecontei]|uniref:Uncharacterized protein LOC124294531 n=1 Tax=Neodiprion lecontei TaxID=441921 RepID=A0ABM3G6Z7_NEOLC|nr:uncharacterized protein LOC124294531 [Neodiprion lecontei]